MALSNYERVGKAMELLLQGLRPFVEREFRGRYGTTWQTELAGSLRSDRGGTDLDVAALLGIMWARWNDVFARTLGPAERSLVSELREARNKWAHQNQFSTDDAYRALDSAQRLLTAISAEEARELDGHKHEILRARFAEQARTVTRAAAVAPVEGRPAAGLRPWREVITPHPDVASGRYQQAEFAADLGQVHRGEGSDEYRLPAEFYRRTFLTDGLRHLLVTALRRLTGNGGDPVVELQTNFGGGKTHSMLALYHLVSGVPAGDLAGIDPVLAEAGVPQPPPAGRAVLVGTALDPARPHRKPDGTEVRTLWGELAYQLGGRAGYALVAEADAHGVSPGSETLRELFTQHAPCLILIDEWVAYVRQLYHKADLAAGSFDANLTFAHALTEAARQAPRTLVVASIPASQIEVGGEGGMLALERLKNTFGRLESAWRPASAEEGYEIVRRRLFQPLAAAGYPTRDAVVKAFADLYQSQAAEFPSGCREGGYERRLRDAYPIHPELFDRLYTDWSSLDKFQRTRGVLRLMATVIHALWEGNDGSLLIMPSTVPVAEPAVQFELTRYLDDPWVPVIEKDVDGPNALPRQLDRDNPALGRYSACRRVARALYLGSAPTFHTANRGLEDRQLKLGCVQPGESPAVFGDALRRLTDAATHLYLDGRRYWYSTQPSVNRLANDRAEQQAEDVVLEEIRKRVRDEVKDPRHRGDFVSVHACPAATGDVPDARETRLVIIAPEHPHTGRATDSPARRQAEAFLAQRGSSPRLYRNTLVFLAPDKTRLDELKAAVRQELAWQSIVNEREELNLDAFGTGQARTKLEQAREAVQQRIPETYTWLLAPGQSEPTGPVEWDEARLGGPEKLAVRAARKLRNDMTLLEQMAGIILRRELDRIPLWRGDHVGIKQLADDFAQYLYLPRLRDTDVLLKAVEEGTALLTWQTDTFAYAEGWDEGAGLYRGLRTGARVTPVLDNSSLVVKGAVATAQRELEADQRERPPAGYALSGGGTSGVREPGLGTTASSAPPEAAPRPVRRFHGTVGLSSTRLSRDADTVASEVVAHLTALLGANARVTLEIEVEVPSGIPEDIIRTVAENCRTLRFTSHGFETE